MCKQNEVRRIRPNAGAPAGLATEAAGPGFEGTREFPRASLGGENWAQRSLHRPEREGGRGGGSAIGHKAGEKGPGLVPEGTGRGVTVSTERWEAFGKSGAETTHKATPGSLHGVTGPCRPPQTPSPRAEGPPLSGAGVP